MGFLKPLGFLVTVFLLKMFVLLQLQDHPLVQPDAGLDTTAYATLATRVLGGDLGLGPGLYFVSPLYIYFLAAILAMTDSFLAVRIVQVLLGTMSVAFIFLMAKAWSGERAAWFAAALAALTGLFTFYEVLILQASIDAFLTSAGLLALTLAFTAPLSRRRAPVHERTRSDRTATRARATTPGVSRAWLFAAGLIFGIQTLNRPNILLAVAGLAVLLVAARRLRPAIVLAAGLFAGMAPVAIRNVVVAGQPSFVSSHGGLNFYIGNNETATGFYRLLPGIRPTIEGQAVDTRRVAEAATGRQLTDAEVSDYFFNRAWDWIRGHPGTALMLFVRKLGYVFNAQHVALPHSYPFYAHDTATLLRFLVIGPWLLLPLGVAGLVVGATAEGDRGARADRAGYLIWASFVPLYAVAVAFFFVAERYRLPLLVPLCVGAGVAVDAVVGFVRTRGRVPSPESRAASPERSRFAPLVVPAAVFVVFALIANWRTGLNDGRWEEGLRLAQRLVILGRYDEADAWARRIRAAEPRRGATEYGLGAQLLVSNQHDRALPHLKSAHEADPAQPHVEYALGQALLKSGRAEEAVSHLRRGFEAGIELPMGGYDYAVALHATGDLAGAADVIRRIRPADDDVEAWLRLGRLAAQSRVPDVAEPFFLHAVNIDPSRAAARQQHGLNLLVLGRFDDAARELAEAVRLDSRDSDSLSHLAYCEFKLGRLADAHAHARAALALNPEDALAHTVVKQVGRGP